MPTLYLNNLSFPADTYERCLEHLDVIRTSLKDLVDAGLVRPSVRCTYRFGELPLSEKLEFLAGCVGRLNGRLRDTALFFLTSLDQQKPADKGLSDDVRVRVENHALEEEARHPDFASTAAIVTCCLDDGVLLSLPTTARWCGHVLSFRALFDDSEEEIVCCNLSERSTLAPLKKLLVEEASELLFGNWDRLSNGAHRSQQVERWMADHAHMPDLEKALMRAISKASLNSYQVDGTVVKSLAFKGDHPFYEIRFAYGGNNTGRMLFGIKPGLGAVFTTVDFKDGNKWYDRVEETAVRYLKDYLAANSPA